MICQTQSKTENRVKRVAVYSDYLALQCGLTGYTIDTINGRHDFSYLPFLRLQRDMPHLALLCDLWQSENVRSNTAGTGIYGFGRDIPAVAEVSQMALLCGLLGLIKTAGAEKYRPAVNIAFYSSALYIKASQIGSV